MRFVQKFKEMKNFLNLKDIPKKDLKRIIIDAKKNRAIALSLVRVRKCLNRDSV